MKQLLACLFTFAFLSCNNNNSEKQPDKEKDSPSAESAYDPKTGISDYTNNKKSFMLTCHMMPPIL